MVALFMLALVHHTVGTGDVILPAGGGQADDSSEVPAEIAFESIESVP
jgi:hypothetical protein